MILAGELWPKIDREHRPWAYWWWMGSAVDEANLTAELTRYAEAGMGGLHIIPIYGAKGFENRYVPYLSERWRELLAFTVKEADRLGLGIDMTLGTGWCFGGPGVSERDANSIPTFSKTGVTLRPSGQKVKRAAPGGEGHMLDPFSPGANRRFTAWIEAGLRGYRGTLPRCAYQDSYEYNAHWTPSLPREFARRRGYDVATYYEQLAANGTDELTLRVRADIRETLSELQVEAQRIWIDWAHQKGMSTRYEAHGSPGNLLDLYGLAEIPETEMFRDDRSVFVSKFASSAAHVCGRKTASAETGTWLTEHFTETLGALKKLCDELFLAGIGHVFWHGTCYSPEDATWPGWAFYASTQANPRNPIWRDIPALHAYISRTQSLLQTTKPDADVLLHAPLYDFWAEPSRELARKLTVHGREWLENHATGRAATALWDAGHAFDFISEAQLGRVKVSGGRLITEGGAHYKALVVPAETRLPPEFVEVLLALRRKGATVIFAGLPTDVPGAKDIETRRSRLRELLKKNRVRAVEPVAGLRAARVRPERLRKSGLEFVRRRSEDGSVLYLLVNRTKNTVSGFIPLRERLENAVLLDAWTGQAFRADVRGNAVRVNLPPGHSVLVKTRGDATLPPMPRPEPSGSPVALAGDWQVRFIAGGPTLPPAYETDAPGPWTGRGPEYDNFSGTARYSLTFDAPQSLSGPALLDLGDVKESVRVRLNGEELGVLILPPFALTLPALKPTGNLLELEVTNLGANRIRDLDLRGVKWHEFHDIGFVNIDYKPFDATGWPVRPAGLLGPVTMQQLR